MAAAFNDVFSDINAGAAVNWRADCLRRIALLPETFLHPFFLDFQRAAATRQQARLADAARRIEAQAAAVKRHVKRILFDENGVLQSVIEFDEMQLEAKP